jgi:hypothetical protein
VGVSTAESISPSAAHEKAVHKAAKATIHLLQPFNHHAESIFLIFLIFHSFNKVGKNSEIIRTSHYIQVFFHPMTLRQAGLRGIAPHSLPRNQRNLCLKITTAWWCNGKAVSLWTLTIKHTHKMIIANPIYDVVFKRLMENERVAKFFIGTLLDQTIEAVEAKPQEITYSNESRGVAIFRLDFIALIKTAEGERKKVLVEIQKAQKKIDLMRFRSYLGEQYKKEDVVDGKNTVLPITTIYILGFTLPSIETPCIKVDRQYYDLINKTVIKQKNYFVESLTHDCYIVQTNRITDRYQTRLDKLLSVFEQTHFTDDKRIVKQYEHEPDEEEVKLMTDILHHSGTDPQERKLIEIEQEAWRTINVQLADQEEEFNKKIEEKEKKIEEKEKVIEEKEKVIGEKEKVIGEKEKVIGETTKALEETAKVVGEQAKALEEKDKEIEALKRRLNMK